MHLAFEFIFFFLMSSSFFSLYRLMRLAPHAPLLIPRDSSVGLGLMVYEIRTGACSLPLTGAGARRGR